MVKTALALVAFLSLQTTSSVGIPFQPWGTGSYQTVNAIEFAPDGQAMFVSLFPAQVAKVEGRAIPADSPEVALYESRRDGERWSAPQLMPFAGRWKDYEASLSPDGQWMLFNSSRPMPGGQAVTKNNLWLTRRTPQGWSSPVIFPGSIARTAKNRDLALPATGWLAPFVGVWDTVDTYHPVTGAPIVERATRTCEMVMQGTYLQCETVATRPSGGGRTYRFLINYNATMKRFEMLSLWSNVQHKAIQVMTPNAARDRWSVRELAVVGDDEPLSPHYSEIGFETADRIVWTGRRVAIGGDPATAPVSFVEHWTKRL